MCTPNGLLYNDAKPPFLFTRTLLTLKLLLFIVLYLMSFLLIRLRQMYKQPIQWKWTHEKFILLNFHILLKPFVLAYY